MNGKSSTFLILVIAAVAFGCFAVKSYYDYQVTMFKHEHGMDKVASTDAQGSASGAPSATGAPAVIPPPPALAGAPAAALPQVNANPPAQAPPAAVDPELERMRKELEALQLEAVRQEKIVAQQKIDAMRADAASSSEGGDAQTSAAPPTAEEAEIEALRQQTVNAPAIAQVVECNWEFDLVFINGGQDRNLQAEEKFAVRRGSDIVGFVTVEEVEANHSVTKLTSSNASSQTALKPQPGDDVIKWPPF